MNKTQARAITGGLGEPSKMPGHAWGISADVCRTGRALAEGGVDGPCADCYALKGHYVYPSVQTAHARRLQALSHPDWSRVMAWSIRRAGDLYFRWHDSGDLQGLDHLDKIAEVARLTPEVKHWLPTQEWSLVRSYIRSHVLPPNLVIRFSARTYDAAPRFKVWGLWSSVLRGGVPEGAYECPASHQGNACGACRACWDPEVRWVAYHKH